MFFHLREHTDIFFFLLKLHFNVSLFIFAVQQFVSASTYDRNTDIICRSDKSQSHQRSQRAFCAESFHVEDVPVWK